MDDVATVGMAQVLRALADLAPSAEQRSGGLTVPTEWFRWLDLSAVSLLMAAPHPLPTYGVGPATMTVGAHVTVSLDRRFGERLAAVDLIRPEERSLRVGWLFVAGRLPGEDGRRRRVLHPLVTMPVRVQQVPLGRPQLLPAGDVELSELVGDPDRRAALEQSIEIGGGALTDASGPAAPPSLLRRLPRLHQFARAVAEAAGLPAHEVVPADDGPDKLTRADRLVIVAGVAVYAVHATGGTSRAGSLRTWAAQPLPRRTALHALYLDADGAGGFAGGAVHSDGTDAAGGAAAPPGDGASPATPVQSPYLLTPVQRSAVARSRVAPVTLISGAPGTGKSHTVAAIACDALARGETVLVAAKTDATVDALLDLLERAPGPDPVVFGSNERREALATRLAGGTLQPVPGGLVEAERVRLEAALARRDALWRSIVDRLGAERLLATFGTDLGDADAVAAGGPHRGGLRAGNAPGTTDPGTTDPGIADPGTTDPGTADPGPDRQATAAGVAAACAAAPSLFGRPPATTVAPAPAEGPATTVMLTPAEVPAPAVMPVAAPAAELDEAEQLLHAAGAPAAGWWARRRRRKARRRLEACVGAAPGTPLDAVAHALRVARAVREATTVVATGGLEIGDGWDQLQQLDDQARLLTARWLAADSRSERRLDRSTLPAVAVLATALRSGRAARRSQLERLDERLTTALPLWVGTLPDIDDLLPPVAGLFDLVILDEGSSIDQPLAAPALLRGRRAVVAGDPRQLRHVSFVSDDQTAKVVGDHRLDASPVLAARLDVRRNSIFDVAAGVAPVLTLDEHFRSDPHLMEFVSRRLYGGAVRLATRAPTSESRDCVTVVRLPGGVRDRNGVVQAEVDQVLRLLRELRDQGTTSVGVVTPFRAQADALERAVLDAFDADGLQALDLRVGTVHGFQGNERDVIVASLGVGEDAGVGVWRFVEDPHLFTVLATRARRRLTLLVSGQPPAGGLVDDYLAQADAPPGRPHPAGAVSAWAQGLADDLGRAGLPVTTAYPTGRHVVDVAFGDRVRSVAVECEVHPAGADAHVDRHLALRRAGWHIVEAHRSRWEDRPGELVVDLANTYAPSPSPGVG